MESIKEKSAQLFASYPEVVKFCFTSDGTAFEQESMAEHHAKSLQNKEIVCIDRSMASASSSIDSAVDEEDGKEDETDATEESKPKKTGKKKTA